MTTIGEDIQKLVAGELPPEDTERVLAAIAKDPAAQAELEECLQLRALAAEAGPSDQLAAHRRRRRWILVAMAAPLAAAAAVALWFGTHPRPAPTDNLDHEFVAALAPHRELQPRLSWPTADHYRPYDPPRAATANAEHIPLDLLARAEKTGDPRALVAAQLLAGNPTAAGAALDHAAVTADALSDRAALALSAGDAERALVHATAALEKQPNHAQASWNRALALRALGLDRSAAAAFDAIAARGEPGWADEARAQAKALHDWRDHHNDAWKHVNEVGRAMVAGGPIPLDQVAAFPGPMRLYFYDAMRAAPSADRVRELVPLADALDKLAGGTVLRAYATRISGADFAVRGKLAARYPALVHRDPDANVRGLIDDARKAHADDVLLGALMFGAVDMRGVIDTDVEEYVRLAHATGDPWFELLAAQQRAAAAERDHDMSAAETILRTAAQRCTNGALAYRCMLIWRALSEVYLGDFHRPGTAADALVAARAAAAAVGSVDIEDDLLGFAASQATLRDDTTSAWLALATAYLEEREHDGSEEYCERAQIARDAAITALANHYRIAEARTMLKPCAKPLSPLHALALALVADRSEIPDQRRAIAAARKTAENAYEIALFDHIDGRLALRVSPDEGRALLRKAIAESPLDGDARPYSYAILVADAGHRHDWAAALALLAEQRHLPTPTGCVLGAAAADDAENDGTVFVAKGPGDAYAGAVLVRRSGERHGEATPPAEILDAIATCPSVDVIAWQPYYGRANLLPASRPWRYLTGPRTRAATNGPTLVIGNIEPPAALHLPPLNPIAAPYDAGFVAGGEATPARVLEAMRDAGFIEIHSHGLSDVGDEAALLVMAPDAAGHYALTSGDIKQIKLRGHPVVVLAACGAGATGHAIQTAYGLADSFIAAGARSVISSPDPIADAAAPKFFAGVHRRIAGGLDAARALADERNSWTDPAQRAWIDRLVVFE